jgi:cell division septation protein DedD
MQDLSKYTKKRHIEIQTKYLSFLAIVSIALVGLVFALGVLVGSRRPQGDVLLRPDALAILDSKEGEPLPTQAELPKLSYHESLKESDSQVPTPASLLSKEEDSQLNGNVTPVATPDLKPRMEEAAIPEEVDQDEPGVYSLQVGSYQEKTEADEMVRMLSKAGYTAFMVSVQMPDRGGLWFRVRVGPFHSKQEVWDKKKEFESRERIPAFVVKRRA